MCLVCKMTVKQGARVHEHGQFDKFQCHADISYDVYMGLLLLGTASALTKQLGLRLPPKRNPTLCLRNCENFTSPSFS